MTWPGLLDLTWPQTVSNLTAVVVLLQCCTDCSAATGEMGYLVSFICAMSVAQLFQGMTHVALRQDGLFVYIWDFSVLRGSISCQAVIHLCMVISTVKQTLRDVVINSA